MLSNDEIDKLIEPVIQRQIAIELYVLKQIASRIKEIGELLPSDLYKLDWLSRFSLNSRAITKELSKMTDLMLTDIEKIIQSAAKETYISSVMRLNSKEFDFKPFYKNKEVQDIIKAISRNTQESFKNISNAWAFMLRSPSDRKRMIPTSLSETYDNVLDKAIQAAKSQSVSYREAMRETIKELNESGIRRVEYESEKGRHHSQRLDTAVRRNLLDGVRQVSMNIQEEIGKEFGANGVELTVHAYPAPDHAPIQGLQFSNEEFKKLQEGNDFQSVDGQRFKGIKRGIGKLNCYHFYFPIVIGVNSPVHSQEELKTLLRQNEDGVTFDNGKHLTKYQCTQEQRRMETDIRRAKEGQMTALAAGDENLALEYQDKVSITKTKYLAFSKKCGLRPKNERLNVDGYKEIKRVKM